MLDKIHKLASELDSFIKEVETNGIKYSRITVELINSAKSATNDMVVYSIINMFCVKSVKLSTSKIVEIMDKSLEKDRYVLLKILTTYEQIFELQSERNSMISGLEKSLKINN